MRRNKNKKGNDAAATAPGGIDPESPEARRANNVKEIRFEDLRLHFLIIKINSASNLKAADITLQGGSSDPFVEVIANGQKFTTQTIMKNLNPVFNEETSFCFFELVNEIEFKVYDWDKGEFGKHDAIGNCTLNTSKFFDKDNPGFKGDITLKNVKHGTLNVEVTGKLIVPKELEVRVENLEKLKAEQTPIVEQKTNEYNTLYNTNTQLKNEKESNENELRESKEKHSQVITEQTIITANIDEAKNDIITTKKERDQAERDNTDTIKENEKLLSEREVLNKNLESEAERKEEILGRLNDLRDSALGKKRLSQIGNGLGKGIGIIGSGIGSGIKGVSNKITEISENEEDKIPKRTASRSTSVDPEKGHMNVSWIRHNAPRESIIEHLGPEKNVLTEE